MLVPITHKEAIVLMNIQRFPVWKIVQVGEFDNIHDLIAVAVGEDIVIDDDAFEVVENLSTSPERKFIRIAIVYPGNNLGLDAEHCSREEIYAAALEAGFQFCEDELPLALRREWVDQLSRETVFVGTPIIQKDEKIVVFVLRQEFEQSLLRVLFFEEELGFNFDPTIPWAFVLPDPEPPTAP